MAHLEAASRPILRCLPRALSGMAPCVGRQAFTTSRAMPAEPQSGTPGPAQTQTQSQPFYRNLDPELVVSPRLERRLMRAGKHPVGSRRRRAALSSTSDIPFEQLPYQCFQEARKILLEDRAEKLQAIETERGRIERLLAADPAHVGGEKVKQDRLQGMMRYLEKLKIYADINDPIVKKKFEDGNGDMNRPIYRFLADREWRQYRRLILMQRLTQMNVVPDVLAHIDPTADVKLAFAKHIVQPGDFVASNVSASPPALTIQTFSQGTRLATIAVVDADVPNLETDSFEPHCHYLAVNVPISPTTPRVSLASPPPGSNVLLPWTAPYALKGSPYHRLAIAVLEQPGSLEPETVAAKVGRHGFSLRSIETRHHLKPIGAHLFRIKWDDHMSELMEKAGYEGADIELRKQKVEPLPYKRRNPASFR